MANDLLNELNRNLKSAEEVGDKEWAKRLKARIAELEKPVKAPAVAAPAAVKTAALTKTVVAPKKAAKKRNK